MAGGNIDKEPKAKAKVVTMSDFREREGFVDESADDANPFERLQKLLPKEILDNYKKDEKAFVEAIRIVRNAPNLKPEQVETLIETLVGEAKDLFVSGKMDDAFVISMFRYYKQYPEVAHKTLDGISGRKPYMILMEYSQYYRENYSREVIRKAVEVAISTEENLKENAFSLFEHSRLFANESYASSALTKAVKIAPRAAFEWRKGFINSYYAGKILLAAAKAVDANMIFEASILDDLLEMPDTDAVRDIIAEGAKKNPSLFFEYENINKYDKKDIFTDIVKIIVLSSKENAKTVLENFGKLGPITPEIITFISKSKNRSALDDYPHLKEFL